MNITYKVSIECMTYNHSLYIVDALTGFVIQKTTFPYIALVFDDASTDGAPEIIRSFLDKEFDLSDDSGCKKWETEDAHWVFVHHKMNENCFFLVAFFKKNLYRTSRKQDLINENRNSKYVAICEGDDYWTDTLKLQKQVDFMESHEDCSLCFHRVGILAADESQRHYFDHLEERAYSAREIYETWTIPTCSAMFRSFRYKHKIKIHYGDTYLWLLLSERGSLYCMNFTGGMYRRHVDSVTGHTDFSEYPHLVDQYRFMGRRFPDLKDISLRKEEDALRIVIKMPYFDGILKYRLRYIVLHPRLLFTTYFTTTILSYTPFRHH